MPRDISQKADEMLKKLLAEEGEEPESETPPSEPEEEETPETPEEDESEEEGGEEADTDGEVSEEKSDDGAKKVNGWKNYQTWNVALWMDNDEGLYNLAKSCTNYEEFAETLREYGVTETPDKVAYNDSNLDMVELDHNIQSLRGEEETGVPTDGVKGGEPSSEEDEDDGGRAEYEKENPDEETPESEFPDFSVDEKPESKKEKKPEGEKKSEKKKEKSEDEGLPDPEKE